MTNSAREQNELLLLWLKKSSTKESLLKVCNVMIAIQGNPRMKQFGVDLKGTLEGRRCV